MLKGILTGSTVHKEELMKEENETERRVEVIETADPEGRNT